MLDDPKRFILPPLHLASQLLFLSSFLAIPLTIFLALWNYRKTLNDLRYSIRVALCAVGILAIWSLNHYDPGPVWDWFLD